MHKTDAFTDIIQRLKSRLITFWICLGEMSEWPNEHAWKACVPKGTEGSNPSLSANLRKNRFSETVIFVPEPRYSGAFRPVQAYRANSTPSRHSPSLALSMTDILCDCPSEAYPSSAVVTLV